MKTIIRTLSLFILLLFVSLPSTTFADSETATVFYEKAAEEYGKGNYKVASDLLYKAYANDPNLIYVYNRILALQADKQYAAALNEMEVFEKRMMEDPERRFMDVPQIKKKLTEQVAASKAANIKTDEVKDPVVKNDDKGGKGKGAEKIDDTIVQPPRANVEEGMSTTEVVGLSLIGVGIVTAGAGAVLISAITTEADDRIREALPDNWEEMSYDDRKDAFENVYDPDGASDCDYNIYTQCQAYKDDVEEVDSLRIVSVGLIAAGAVLTLGGGYLYFSGGSNSKGEVPVSANATQLQFAPYVSADGAGAVFQLKF